MMIADLSQVSSQALAQLRRWLEQNPPATHVRNVLGFTQAVTDVFMTQAATASVTAREGTTSATYTDLATVGPTVSALTENGNGLPVGKYLVFYNCQASMLPAAVAPQSNYQWMAPLVTGSAASDDDAVVSSGRDPVYIGSPVPQPVTVCGFKLVTFATADPTVPNAVTLKYRVNTDGPNGYFAERHLVVVKYADP